MVGLIFARRPLTADTVTVTMITGTMITLRTQLNQLEKEIKADRKGIRDFDMTIERLRLEADALLEAEERAAEQAKADADNQFYSMVFTYTAEAAALAEEEAKKEAKEGAKA